MYIDPSLNTIIINKHKYCTYTSAWARSTPPALGNLVADSGGGGDRLQVSSCCGEEPRLRL